MPHRSLVFKTRVLCKKNFTYSGVFKPYSDVLKPYNNVFLQFMELESLKLDFYVDFFPHLIVFRPLKQLIKPRKLAKLLLSPIKQV